MRTHIFERTGPLFDDGRITTSINVGDGFTATESHECPDGDVPGHAAAGTAAALVLRTLDIETTIEWETDGHHGKVEVGKDSVAISGGRK